MVLSSLITMLLVGLVLLVYLRSVKMLVLLSANILAATLVAFGLAAITVGHLNAATAFLGAIIAGNGVNYGILLVARYLEGLGAALETLTPGRLRAAWEMSGSRKSGTWAEVFGPMAAEAGRGAPQSGREFLGRAGKARAVVVSAMAGAPTSTDSNP
jgi:hypothetical protein